MKIIEAIKQRNEDLRAKPVTIAFLGDSVTQGCFECYKTEQGLDTIFDYKSAYSTRVKEMLNFLYPRAQINIINSGISGDGAYWGSVRVERDVLEYNPDLVVVSYGLNDSTHGRENLDNYRNLLEQIFEKISKRNIETIFLTQNYMNTKTSVHLQDDVSISLSKEFAEKIQNPGVLKNYFEVAKKACEKWNVTVCDLYSWWETLEGAGVDVTELLANKLNHPVREMHYYTAIKLIETMLTK